MNGFLRIVDVPGLGAGMRLHEEITLEEMKKEDAMIVLVADAGRQRVDEMKSLSAVNWIKENRLYGLRGSDLDDAAAKIFVVVNGANIRQAFDRLNSGLPEAEREIKEVTRHIAPNYWEAYADRGDNRPYFMVMTPSALYVQDPENAPHEFAGGNRAHHENVQGSAWPHLAVTHSIRKRPKNCWHSVKCRCCANA